jgi:N-acetylmuramoyl-L-alanine amidase
MIKIKYLRKAFAAFCLFTLASFYSQDAIKPLTIAIDIGHSPRTTGSLSARGISEYQYNAIFSFKLLQALQQQGYRAFILSQKNPEMTLLNRARLASIQANVLLSIHHDSVQPHYFKSWIYQQKQLRYSDNFQGHALFVSSQNPKFEQSQQLAKALGLALYQQGLRPTLHHNEKIAGENKALLNPALGIYRYDDLILLHHSKIPSVLLECGLIVNRAEELRLRTERAQQKMIRALIRGLRAYQHSD